MSYDWVIPWLANDSYSKKTTRLLLSTKKDREEDCSNGDRRNKSIIQVLYSPSPGNHFFKYRGKWIWLSFTRENMGESGLFLGFHDTLIFTCLKQHKGIVKDLILEAKSLYHADTEKSVGIFVHKYSRWEVLKEKNCRSLKSLIFSNNIVDELENDIKEFLGKKEWYNDMGIPWNRGYLLHGEPGNGKTSLISALAGHFNLDIYFLSLTNKALDDGSLFSLLVDIPHNCILLLEDVDCLKRSGDSSEGKDDSGVSHSGLLNAIDGAAATEGRILFMTTNFRDKLDAALIRGGRIDRKFCIENATRLQSSEFFAKFYSDASVGEAEKFSEFIPERQVSMARIQEHLFQYKEPLDAIANAAQLNSESL